MRDSNSFILPFVDCVARSMHLSLDACESSVTQFFPGHPEGGLQAAVYKKNNFRNQSAQIWRQQVTSFTKIILLPPQSPGEPHDPQHGTGTGSGCMHLDVGQGPLFAEAADAADVDVDALQITKITIDSTRYYNLDHTLVSLRCIVRRVSVHVHSLYEIPCLLWNVVVSCVSFQMEAWS